MQFKKKFHLHDVTPLHLLHAKNGDLYKRNKKNENFNFFKVPSIVFEKGVTSVTSVTIQYLSAFQEFLKV